MDSRIREIEQWVAEAKANLGDCGRDAYINKLYLLDAEIRAVIRENGIPAATSPGQQFGRVRRPMVPALPIAGALGVLFLVAATVYFAIQLTGDPSATAPGLRAAAPAPASGDAPMVIGYIPNDIPGEEILLPGWMPNETAAVIATAPALAPAVAPATETQPVLLANQQPEPAAASTQPRPAGSGSANTATPVLAVGPVPRLTTPVVIAAAGSNTGAGSASFNGTELERTVSTKFGYFPETGGPLETPVNETMRQLANQLHGVNSENHSVDNVDSSNSAEDDSVDNSEPGLDSSALAEFLERKINQHTKR